MQRIGVALAVESLALTFQGFMYAAYPSRLQTVNLTVTTLAWLLTFALWQRHRSTR